MKVSIASLPDPRLRDFLTLLGAERLRHIVVAGGSVRDALLGRPSRDIDIAIRLDVDAPTVLRTGQGAVTKQLLPQLEEALAPLASVLQCRAWDFMEPVPFETCRLDVLGLYAVQDEAGVTYPDIFVDRSEVLFGATPELTVNRLWLDCEGVVLPTQSLTDLKRRVARFTSAPQSIRFRQVLRAFRTCAHYDLALCEEAADTIRNCLIRLDEVEFSRREMADDDTLALLREIFPAAANGAGISFAEIKEEILRLITLPGRMR
jgi:hypothetical protein